MVGGKFHSRNYHDWISFYSLLSVRHFATRTWIPPLPPTYNHFNLLTLSLTPFLFLSALVNSALKFSVNVKDQKTDVRYTSRARRRSISCNPQPVRVSVGISFTKILLDMEIVIVSRNFAWVCLSRRIFWSNFKPPRGCSSLRQKKIKEGYV